MVEQQRQPLIEKRNPQPSNPSARGINRIFGSIIMRLPVNLRELIELLKEGPHNE